MRQSSILLTISDLEATLVLIPVSVFSVQCFVLLIKEDSCMKAQDRNGQLVINDPSFEGKITLFDFRQSLELYFAQFCQFL